MGILERVLTDRAADPSWARADVTFFLASGSYFKPRGRVNDVVGGIADRTCYLDIQSLSFQASSMVVPLKGPLCSLFMCQT